MKKTIIILITLAAIFATCKKEDRDEIFKSRTHRYLTGIWQVEKILINNIDSTFYLMNNESLIHYWSFYYHYKDEGGNLMQVSNKLKQYFYARWTLTKKNNQINIYTSTNTFSQDTNLYYKWFSSGVWQIREIKKEFLRVSFNNNTYEYEFKKIHDY